MNEILSALYTSISEVMMQMAGEEALIRTPTAAEIANFDTAYFSHMDLLNEDKSPTGGWIEVYLDEETTEELVNRFIGFPDEGPTEEDNIDGVNELLNVIAGGIKARLAGTEDHFYLSVPTSSNVKEQEKYPTACPPVANVLVEFDEGKYIVSYSL
jgi:CheY-specific phosphatase CheX